MYTSHKHPLAPESVTSASSAGGGYSQKRRRIVQNTPVPEKYLYRHSTSRLSASRASSVLGESDAPDGSSLGALGWARDSTLSDGARIITDGDKGKGVEGVAVEVKRSSMIPESPFARIISRQKQSRGISTTTTSLAYRSPNGSLRTSYGARCNSPQNTMVPPSPFYTASVHHTGRGSDMSPPQARPISSGSQQIHSSFQMSKFEFTSPFKPKPSVTLNTSEENKAKSDSLLSFFGNALSRAKSALNENRELQDAERKRKLKEDARRRAIEEERRKRDEVFAEIAREEEELAKLVAPKDRDMETQFPSIASVANRQPLTSATVSRAVSSSITTVVHEPNSCTEQRSEDHIALAQPRSSDVLTLTDQALVNGIQTQELPKAATPKQASPRPTESVARPVKPQVEVICLDSDSEEEEQDQQRKPQSAQSNGRGTTFHNVENEEKAEVEEEEEEEEEGEVGYDEGVSDDDGYEDEDGEGAYGEKKEKRKKKKKKKKKKKRKKKKTRKERKKSR
ncbi:hypothetical protein L211DRAFT_378240 [Terfezia boudieri ATCC MYA-4762]|uniref:Uncharacterized protein n=1 Tax=Terfezia boudieri ATCC MYA-4762 TaxID=1051890 RepID=A0A3N4M4S2_9PEZI|nr:hypothetical protein L211DRAFT_378240 [Terfezia boudieri ATCC MYA-4762]